MKRIKSVSLIIFALFVITALYRCTDLNEELNPPGTIGFSGGTVFHPSGAYLEIPPGALELPTPIELSAVKLPLPTYLFPLSIPFKVSPEDLQLPSKLYAKLSIPLRYKKLPYGRTPFQLNVYHFKNKKWSKLPAAFDEQSNSAIALIQRAGIFVAAIEPIPKRFKFPVEKVPDKREIEFSSDHTSPELPLKEKIGTEPQPIEMPRDIDKRERDNSRRETDAPRHREKQPLEIPDTDTIARESVISDGGTDGDRITLPERELNRERDVKAETLPIPEIPPELNLEKNREGKTADAKSKP